MFDNYQIFDKYARFLEQWRQRGKPKLFVATMDIRKCYDSVDIQRLVGMIRTEQFFEEQYIVHQFVKVIRSKRYLFSKDPADVRDPRVPSLTEASHAKGDSGISREKREKFAKRGGMTRRPPARKVDQAILLDEEARNVH